MPPDSTAGGTARQGSWTKPHGVALQAAEAVAFILESSMHDLSVFSDHGKKGIVRPEHAKRSKSGLPVNTPTSLTSPTTDFGQHPSLARLLQVCICARFTEQCWRAHSSPPKMDKTNTFLHKYYTAGPERSSLSYAAVTLELGLQHPTAPCIHYIMFHKL